MTISIPLAAVPSQTLDVVLGNQAVTLNVYQKSFGLYVDVLINDAPIRTGVIAQNLNRIIRDAYLGFIGSLYFYDTQGASDPDYTGLGARFQLYYDAT